jgi:ankyrin repeat protein
MEGNKEIVKLLVEREDVEADSRDNDGRTPLMLAAQVGHEGIVKLLVEREDVEADSRDNDGRTPLMLVAQTDERGTATIIIQTTSALAGQKGVVKVLVQRDDVDANLKDSEGQTPLMLAVKAGKGGIARLLIELRGVEVDSKDNKGYTPLMLAIRGCKKIEETESDKESSSGSESAVLSDGGCEAIVKLLLEREDVDPAATNNVGETPLSLAEQNGHQWIVDLVRQKLGHSEEGENGGDLSKAVE